ncbi:MAG: esterase-like activity of phytase family protein [Gammaproteobacteria bacterium]|nr:esterase-like activity of phytase family protein [Gammaproteobacteria bacterium]
MQPLIRFAVSPGPIVALALFGNVVTAQAGIAGLTYYGEFRIASGSETADGIPLGGISGIDYVAASGRYVAISDDRSQRGPARYYDVQIDVDASGFSNVSFSDAIALLDSDGAKFASGTVDPEAIRYDASGDALYWVSEGNARRQVAPFVRESGNDGSHRRDLLVPRHYRPTATRGVRNNRGFEGLTLTTDGRSLWVATENALFQDGPAATLHRRSPARILTFDLATGNPGAEYVYEIDPIPGATILPSRSATNGLVEILALNATQFIAVERAFAFGVGNSIRLYLADLSGATDVSALPDGIVGKTVTPIEKTLLHDLGADFDLRLDNIEGITFGPEIDGRRSLLLVSDNNFSSRQVTQFLAFGIDPAAPASAPARPAPDAPVNGPR